MACDIQQQKLLDRFKSVCSDNDKLQYRHNDKSLSESKKTFL